MCCWLIFWDMAFPHPYVISPLRADLCFLLSSIIPKWRHGACLMIWQHTNRYSSSNSRDRIKPPDAPWTCINLILCNVYYIGKLSCAVWAHWEAVSGDGAVSPTSDPRVFTSCVLQDPLIWGWASSSVTEREENSKSALPERHQAFEKVNHLHQMLQWYHRLPWEWEATVQPQKRTLSQEFQLSASTSLVGVWWISGVPNWVISSSCCYSVFSLEGSPQGIWLHQGICTADSRWLPQRGVPS